MNFFFISKSISFNKLSHTYNVNCFCFEYLFLTIQGKQITFLALILVQLIGRICWCFVILGHEWLLIYWSFNANKNMQEYITRTCIVRYWLTVISFLLCAGFTLNISRSCGIFSWFPICNNVSWLFYFCCCFILTIIITTFCAFFLVSYFQCFTKNAF